MVLVELCLPLLKTIYPKGLAVPRCGTEDITAGHTQGMITKDSPLSAHRLVWRWVLSGDLAVGIAMALVELCLPLLETIYSKGLAVLRCKNRRYHCWSFSRHDQRETLRLHSRRSRGGEQAGRARRRSWVLSSCMPREPLSAEGRAASVQSEARARGRQSARSAWVVTARETLSLAKTTPWRRG